MASMDSAHIKPSTEVHEPVEHDIKESMKGAVIMIDVLLRALLFATALVAVVVMVTSNQTKLMPVMQIPVVAKFNQSPAFIYLVAALSVACLYSIISGALSVLALMKPGGASSTMLQFQFLILDALLLGIVAAATGAGGGMGYIGLKGNTHTGWNKVCDTFASALQHPLLYRSLISSITLVLLVWHSVYVLSKKIKSR